MWNKDVKNMSIYMGVMQYLVLLYGGIHLLDRGNRPTRHVSVAPAQRARAPIDAVVAPLEDAVFVKSVTTVGPRQSDTGA